MAESAPIFAVHGWALNAAVFEPLGEDLAGRPLLAVDLPGHGMRRNELLGSDPAPLVARLLEQAPGRSIWLGWSLGGMLALGAALQAPERIEALVIVCAAASFICRPHWPRGMPREQLRRMAADLALAPREVVSNFLALQVLASPGARTALRGLHEALKKRGEASAQALGDGLRLLEIMDYSTVLGQLEVPVLVITGDRDRLVTPESAQALGDGLPHGRCVHFRQAAHVPFLTHRALFETTIAAELERWRV